MALETTVSRVEYAGNGVTTAFSFPYYFLAEEDLVVIQRVNSTGVETTKTLTTHYTVTGEGEEAGGTVTMLVAPPTGQTLIIYRDPAITQGSDWRENDSLPAEQTERAHDRAAMISQRLKDRVDRTVRLSDGFSPDFDPTLPSTMDDAAGKIPLINADSDGWADTDDWPDVDGVTAGMEAILADAEAAQAAAEAAQAAAETAETNAETAETNAETAETNAETAEANAEAAQAAAEAAQASAEAAAAAAAAALASAFFRDVVYITSANSPFTVTSAHNGKLISANTSGGAISVTLPQISTLTPPFNVGFLLATAGNDLTLNRAGTDTIGGATSKVLSAVGTGTQLVADVDGSPDDWSPLDFGTAADDAITNAKLANMAQATIKGRASGAGTGDPTDLTPTQVAAMLTVPTMQRLTAVNGTYTTPAGCKWIRVRLVGAGGGGCGSAAVGNKGGDTTFGTSLLTAIGGSGGPGAGQSGGAGGSFTVASPALDVGSMIGNWGHGGDNIVGVCGGNGGNSVFGGNGKGGANSGGSAGQPAAPQSGSGGGGAGSVGGGGGNPGGGSGGYVEAVITAPSASYTFSCGTAAAGGSGPPVGGNGGSGVIIVEEYYV